jgi:hypothetical protein
MKWLNKTARAKKQSSKTLNAQKQYRKLARTQKQHRQASRFKARCNSGQMTIEYAIMFPVMLAIALIATNSILFLGECSSFDRLFRESVCVLAPSPASEQTSAQVCAQIEESLDEFKTRSYLNYEVSSAAGNDDLTTYSATLSFTPTLFGSNPLRQVFGVSLPALTHTVTMSIDAYKPGVFL